LVFDHGLPARGVTVRAYDVRFGGRDALLGEAKSDNQGGFSIAYQPQSAQNTNLQVRVLGPDNKEVTVSTTRFGVGQAEILTLTVPGSVQPLAAEFQRLSDDMKTAVGGIAALGQAEESATRQDLTLLNQSTSWDARLLALAATAAKEADVMGLGGDVLYALYRVGMPTDPSLLAMVPSAAVQKALTKASQAGVIALNADQITAATSAFRNFAAKARLTMTAPGAVSHFGDLLGKTIADPTQQAAFTELFFNSDQHSEAPGQAPLSDV
jgi:hypothetical protein